MENIVHVGIGPLGAKTVRYAVERGCFNIVGAVDTDPEKAGKDLVFTVRPSVRELTSSNCPMSRSG